MDFLYVLIPVVVVIVLFLIVRARKSNTQQVETPAAVQNAAPVATPVQTAPKAPGSAGELKLHSVPDKQAAMIMAIVADTLKTPLNELRFKSIRLIDEENN